jgi:hypothetical protein
MNYRDCRALPFLSRCIMRREGGREEEGRRKVKSMMRASGHQQALLQAELCTPRP